jgi:hypothetical protein
MMVGPEAVASSSAATRLSISACSVGGSGVGVNGGVTVPVPIVATKARWRAARARNLCPALVVYMPLEIGGTVGFGGGSSGGLLWPFPTGRLRGLDVPAAFLLAGPFLMRLLRRAIDTSAEPCGTNCGKVPPFSYMTHEPPEEDDERKSVGAAAPLCRRSAHIRRSQPTRDGAAVSAGVHKTQKSESPTTLRVNPGQGPAS